MEKLKRYNAWGTVSVSGQEIVVTLTAVSTEGKPVNRTIRLISDKPLVLSGTDIIAVDIKPVGQEIAVRAMGEHDVTSAPEVKRALRDSIDWIRKSVDL
ncbi:MAG: hypothetical protein WCK35_11150 [Chloroflexota bacterium]